MEAMVASPAAFAEEFSERRWITEKTVAEIRHGGYPPGTAYEQMTLEEFQAWNSKYSAATDETVIPAMEPIKYKKLSPSN
jgi:hypothetical protein